MGFEVRQADLDREGGVPERPGRGRGGEERDLSDRTFWNGGIAMLQSPWLLMTSGVAVVRWGKLKF